MVLIADGDVEIPDSERSSLGIGDVLKAPLELDDLVRALHSTFEEWQELHPNLPLADFRSGIRDKF